MRDSFEHRQVRFALTRLLNALPARNENISIPRQTGEKGVDHGGLANAGLSRNKYDAAFRTKRHIEQAAQHREFRVAPGEPASCRCGVLRRRRQEPVAAPMFRADVLGVIRVIAQRFADLFYISLEHAFLNEGVYPNGVQQFLLRDEAAGFAGEMAQDGESLGRQLDLAAVTLQGLIVEIEPEWSDGNHLVDYSAI